jgi:hypothetical protein
MLPRLPQFSDPELQKLVRELTAVLGNLSKDNFNAVTVTGTTSGTANTSAKFRHNLKAQPSMVLILEGNAYVARQGVGPTDVDIRSTATSQPFLALVVR